MMEPALDGAQRAANQRGNLTERCPGEEPQLNHHPMGLWKGRYCRLDKPRLLCLLGS